MPSSGCVHRKTLLSPIDHTSMAESATKCRVVLDTNVVLSALVFNHGKLALVRQAWQARRFIPVVSRETTSELVRVLTYRKFRVKPDEQEKLLTDYLPYVETHTINLSVQSVSERPICRDPKDQVFLDLACSAQVDVLVSGDEDLLVLEDPLHATAPFRILTPQDFLAALKAKEPQ